ncbi:hypothetical protein NRB15_03920 [Pseudomonas alliivorans]|nr:hypothetical protein [Pseudomonas alliivorans]
MSFSTVVMISAVTAWQHVRLRYACNASVLKKNDRQNTDTRFIPLGRTCIMGKKRPDNISSCTVHFPINMHKRLKYRFSGKQPSLEIKKPHKFFLA